MYPTGKTSNPTSIQQNAEGTYQIADAGVQRVVNIVVDGVENMADGDRFALRYYDEVNQTNDSIWFVCDNDNSISTGYDAGDTANSFMYAFFDYTVGDTDEHVANNIKNAINRFSKYHTATIDGSTVTITYNQIPPTNKLL